MQGKVHPVLTVGLALLLAVADASAAPANLPAPAPAWPPPPQAPRIVYVQALTRPADAGIRPSALRRLGNWITGAQKGNEPLRKPFGLAVDEQDNLCLTDTGNAAVGYLDFAHKKWSYWTSVGPVKWAVPVAIAKTNHVFYVADSGLGAVIAFNDKGRWLFQITNGLSRPAGLAIAGGRLYVADSQSHCVAVFALDGRPEFQFGKRGTGPGQFNFPTHVGADRAGHIFVTDSINGRVEVFDLDGHYLNQIGSAGDGFGQFNRPKGVAADAAGHVYVVDAVFGNIQIFSREGALLLNVGEAGAGPGQFWLPNGIAISRENQIFVSDAYNHRIQILKYVGPP